MASALALALIAQPAIAAPPLFPTQVEEGTKTCFVNKEAFQARLAARSRFAPGVSAAISATAYTVAVVRIDFSDKAMTKTLVETQSFFDSVKTFYSENSYGFLSVNATVSPAIYRMPQTHAYYANGLNTKYSELTADAVAAAVAAGFNFSSYNHIMIYHSGEGAETSTSPSTRIWSVYLPASSVSGPTASGKTFSGVTIVPELEFDAQGGTSGTRVSPLGVICHEYGHQLGLPDLYSTAGSQSSSIVGQWSVMDSGVYLGSPLGSNPAHFDAWSKQFLGFSTPETASVGSTPVTKSLSSAETSRSSFLRIPISASSVGGNNEYYLIEYRNKTAASYDNSLSASGLLIWHVDDSIALNQTRLDNNTVNTGTPNRGVDVVESDSTDSSNGGDSGDPWTSGTLQTPKANAFNGQDSGVILNNISGAGGSSMSFKVQNTLSNTIITQNTSTGTVNIASTGDNGYVNPSKGEKSLIGIRPNTSATITVKIYSLSGDLVRENSFQGTGGQITTYSWDGKNSDSAVVTSGIYLVHISGGGLDVKKKIAILR